ncbi:ShlB/FhaC/HecB family hemolysin secretion/activation protein [Bradyrhizobium betae]|uniref:ShlB/FhaC/HecB family hemolysin secretion/activation protein n=1 Tax=Bradyrhizobium betae TaxID=244734 RepID=UPI003D66E991
MLLNAAETEGKTVSRFATVDVTNDHYDRATAGVSVTNSGNTYSITVSPAVNYIEWQDHVLGNNRTFNTYTGSLIATSAAGPANFSTNLLASWQYTQEKLLPGDQIFSIGGPTTVRGYPSNAASGDSGYYFNAELHYNWSQWLRDSTPTSSPTGVRCIRPSPASPKWARSASASPGPTRRS